MQLQLFPQPWTLGLLLGEDPETGNFNIGTLPVIGIWTTIYINPNTNIPEPLFEPVVALQGGRFIRGSQVPVEMPDATILFLIGPGEDAAKVAVMALRRDGSREAEKIDVENVAIEELAN